MMPSARGLSGPRQRSRPCLPVVPNALDPTRFTSLFNCKIYAKSNALLARCQTVAYYTRTSSCGLGGFFVFLVTRTAIPAPASPLRGLPAIYHGRVQPIGRMHDDAARRRTDAHSSHRKRCSADGQRGPGCRPIGDRAAALCEAARGRRRFGGRSNGIGRCRHGKKRTCAGRQLVSCGPRTSAGKR